MKPQDIAARQFIEALAAQLKSMPEFAPPPWGAFVKTSHAKERPPERDDWWYVRAASILRAAYMRGVIGVNRLRTKYGSRKNRGVAPKKFYRAGGKIIRTVLQQAEVAGLLEKTKGKRAGRTLTKKGGKFLEKIASEMLQ